MDSPISMLVCDCSSNQKELQYSDMWQASCHSDDTCRIELTGVRQWLVRDLVRFCDFLSEFGHSDGRRHRRTDNGPERRGFRHQGQDGSNGTKRLMVRRREISRPPDQLEAALEVDLCSQLSSP